MPPIAPVLLGIVLGLASLGAVERAHDAARLDALLAWQDRPESAQLLRCQMVPALNSVAPGGAPQADTCPEAEVARLEALKTRALAITFDETLIALVN